MNPFMSLTDAERPAEPREQRVSCTCAFCGLDIYTGEKHYSSTIGTVCRFCVDELPDFAESPEFW